jgi:LETM1 and EF-hand domain-containing protein 1, mitochondrial
MKIEWTEEAWKETKHVSNHYWTGFKLLGKDIQISINLLKIVLKGGELTRRQKKQVNNYIKNKAPYNGNRFI